MRSGFTLLTTAALLGLAAAPALADESHAVVSAAGSLVRGDDAVRASRTALGRYTVTFDSSVRNCAYVATVGQPGTGTLTPGVAMAGGSSNARVVRVETRALNGAYANRAFHLIVICDDDDDDD
jgi:hypothetical protein